MIPGGGDHRYGRKVDRSQARPRTSLVVSSKCDDASYELVMKQRLFVPSATGTKAARRSEQTRVILHARAREEQ